MAEMIAKNGKVVTDEMIAKIESSLERDEWPSGWENVGEVVNGGLPSSLSDMVTLSVKVPASMKKAIESEAGSEGISTSAYVRGVLAGSLMAAV